MELRAKVLLQSDARIPDSSQNFHLRKDQLRVSFSDNVMEFVTVGLDRFDVVCAKVRLGEIAHL